ncbi:MAG: SPOR domain-containing protein [Bacteroidaceae bacterium]|nr:SPOR domain-containing protein [Bacteroidaceae bacterium]
MKKLLVLGLALCSVMAFTSCKSSKSEYKKAYDQAQQRELAGEQSSEPIEIAPVNSSTTSGTTTSLDTRYRTEKVVLTSGAEGSLKDFSVVCGSFGRKEGAESVKAGLVAQGYNAIIVQNPETGMYRVVCGSFDTKQQAAEYREQFKANNPDNADFQKAWLLYNK